MKRSSKIGMIKNGGNDLLSIRIFYLFLSIQQAVAAAATVACKEPRLSHSLRGRGRDLAPRPHIVGRERAFTATTATAPVSRKQQKSERELSPKMTSSNGS